VKEKKRKYALSMNKYFFIFEHSHHPTHNNIKPTNKNNNLEKTQTIGRRTLIF